MKKIYEKPDAEYITFYSDEDIASVLPLNDFNGVGGGTGVGSDMSAVTPPPEMGELE